ncbi:MAG: hypothetical protein KDB53_12090, partial [Planctomycetes bacterium]|nr:hypothetical protein [Planctomycetota bacterium]
GPGLDALPLSSLTLRRGRRVSQPAGSRAVLRSGDDALAVLAGAPPQLVLGFDPVAEGWADQMVFPLLLRSWLGLLGLEPGVGTRPGRLWSALPAGRILELPPGQLTMPDGVVRMHAGGGLRLHEAGLYRLELRPGDPVIAFAVATLDPVATRARARTTPRRDPMAPRTGGSRWTSWSWLLALVAALSLLVVVRS